MHVDERKQSSAQHHYQQIHIVYQAMQSAYLLSVPMNATASNAIACSAKSMSVELSGPPNSSYSRCITGVFGSMNEGRICICK